MHHNARIETIGGAMMALHAGFSLMLGWSALWR